MAEYIDKKYLDRKFQIDMMALRGGTIFDTKKIIDSLPTSDVIEIPKNATNGDMIKAMFPNMEIECLDKHLIYTNGLYKSILREKPYNDHEDNVVLIARSLGDWWNAPYKRGNENEISSNIFTKVHSNI